MATCIWTGGGDGVTWSSGANWNGGAAPTTGDSVQILTGNWAITAGLSQAAVTLADFIIGPQFTGQIGSAGTSLTIAVSGTLTYNGRASICNITAGTANVAKAKVLQTAGQFNLSGGTWTQLELGQSGNAYITASAVVTNLLSAGGNCYAESGTAFTTVEFGGGRLTSLRNLGTADVVGLGTVVSAAGSATGTTVKVAGGSRLNWQSSGTITNLKAYAGSKVDAAGSLYGFTVTNNYEHSGSDVFRAETVAVAITNQIDIGMA